MNSIFKEIKIKLIRSKQQSETVFQSFYKIWNIIDMENHLRLPNQLCERIFSHQFQIDTGNISQQIITNTIQLYVQAISIYTSLAVQQDGNSNFNKEGVNRRSQFYQDKIKRLLVRSDVQQCLIGKKSNGCGLDLKKEISKMKENVPQQAKLLVQYFKDHMKHQEKLIEQTISHQNNDLNQRIRRRSCSKGKKNHTQFRPILINL